MVHYPNPKFIKKSHLRGQQPYAFLDADKRADHVATVETCLRCAQNIAKQNKECEKPEHRRCKHCVKGNRGGCTKVPTALNGRLNRLIHLRRRYDAAVLAAAVPRTDATVIDRGIRLARCQRQFNLELSSRRRIAAHTGTPMGVATQVPTTSPQFLGLILVEQRRIASALEQLVGHIARMGGGGGGNADEESDQEEEMEIMDEGDEGGGGAGGDGGDGGDGVDDGDGDE